MSERARLADREQEEALRRAAHPDGAEAATPALGGMAMVGHARAGSGAGSPGQGAPRGMGPSTLMAMQRLAGNRATVQALRPSRSNEAGIPTLVEEEQAVAGGDAGESAAATSSQADMAVGTPGGGASGGSASGGSAQPGAGGGSAGLNGGSNAGNRRAAEIAAGVAGARAGSNAAGMAGEIAAGTAGSNAAGRAGEIAAGTAGGAAGAGASGKAGETAAGAAGASAGSNAAGKAGETAAGAAAGAAGSSAAGKAGEIAAGSAGGAAGAGAGSGASGKAGEIAAGAAGGSAGSSSAGAAAGAAGSSAAGKAGEVAAGSAGGAAGAAAGGATAGSSRKTPPPPIVGGGSAGAAGAAGGNAISVDGGAGAGGAAGRAGGNVISVDGAKGGGAAAGKAGGNAVSVGGGATGATGAGTIPAPGPTAAPAPGAAPTGPGGVPAPEAAATGIDWAKMLADYGPPARTALELTRMIPGWGLLGGLASDSLNFASDMEAIPNSENADLATGLIIFRNVVNIGNNGLGHVLYVNQLIQDGLAGSVVGAEFTPLTAAANETLSTVKVVLDEVQMGTDIVVEVESLYRANHAPTSAEAEQWRSLADGYAANILGDVVNLVLDVISLSSAGAANTAPVQQGRQPLTLAAAFMKNATPNIISAVNGVLGVWLGSLITEGRQAYVGSPTDLRAQAFGLDAAALVVEGEGSQARMTYDGINLAIDALAAYADDQIAQINMVAETLSGGKSAFELIRDAVQTGLDDMNRKLIMVQDLGAMATDGKANAAAISEACDSVLTALDGLVLPDVTLPSVDMGDGIIADAAAAVANEAAELANAAIREAMSSVSESIEQAKGTIRGPVEAARSEADALGEWLALLATECTNMIGTLTGHIASFSEGLGKCTNIEQVIDLIIGQVSDLTGMPRVTVAEIRAAWGSIGPYIDQFIALAPRMHARATDLRDHADLLESGGGADSTAAPPPEPPAGPGGTPPGGTPPGGTQPSIAA